MHTYTVYNVFHCKTDVQECQREIPIRTVAKISSDEQNRRRRQRLAARNTRLAATRPARTTHDSHCSRVQQRGTAAQFTANKPETKPHELTAYYYWFSHTHTHRHTHTHTHTHTHPFNGPLSGTTRVSRYQKGKTNLDFTEARDSEWQWQQLGNMQVCTSLYRQITTPVPHHSVFYRPHALPAAQPTASKH